jgi:hypothetical protein
MVYLKVIEKQEQEKLNISGWKEIIQMYLVKLLIYDLLWLLKFMYPIPWWKTG